MLTNRIKKNYFYKQNLIIYYSKYDFISQRTKEAFARKRAEGVILGRPKGRKSSKTKLTGQEKKIHELLNKKVSYSAIGRILGVHRLTVSSFCKRI